MKYNSITILTKEESGSEPVTLAEAKAHLYVTFSADDSLITSLIKAARQWVEGQINKSLVSKTITARVNNGKGGQYLLYPPIDDISSVVDKDGNDLTIVSVNGELMTEFDYGVVEYTTTGTVTEEDKNKVLNRVAYLYKNRGEETNQNLNKIWLV